MLKKVYNLLFVIAGVSLGVTMLPAAWALIDLELNKTINNPFTNGVIGALIFLVLALVTSPSFFKALRKLEEAISKKAHNTCCLALLGRLLVYY